jgi:hypothetical protein
MLERRKSSRRKMVLPVKVSIDKVTHLAHTIDITHIGAPLGAIRTQLETNDHKFAARVETSEVPNRMDSAGCPE